MRRLAWVAVRLATSPAVRTRCTVIAGAGGLSAATVRTILREEMAAHALPASGEAEERPEAGAGCRRTPLRADPRAGDALTPSEAEEVLRILAPAINAGRMQVELDGPRSDLPPLVPAAPTA